MAGRETDICTLSQLGLALTAVTVAVTGPLLSNRLHVAVHRPVESVVHVRFELLLNRSTMRTVTDALDTAYPFELRTIFTRAMAL